MLSPVALFKTEAVAAARTHVQPLVTPANVAMTAVTLLVAFLVLYPLSMLLFGSVWTSRPGFPGALTLQHYIDAYTNVETYRLFAVTALLMGAKTIVAMVLAVGMAWLVTRTDMPLRGPLEVLIIVPFFMPGILEAIGWILLLSPRTGTINVALQGMLGLAAPPFNIYSLGGMIWVLALGSVSFIFLLVVSALRNMDASLEEAASASGASPGTVVWRVTLPLVGPAILGATMLSFIRALEAFEVPVLIGVPAKIFVFTNRIYSAVEYDYPTNYGLATALGVTFIAVTLGLLALQGRLLGGRQFSVVSGKGYQPRLVRLGRLRYLALALCLGYFLVAAVLPLSQLAIGSFSRSFGLWDPAALTLANYGRVLADAQLWRGLRNTVLLGLGTALVTMLLCSVVAYIVTRTSYAARRPLEFMAWLPWAIPGIVAGLGILWAYVYFPLPIYGTVFLLGLAFLIGGLPLGVQLMSGVMVQIGRELEESARVHGASWLQTYWRVVLPLMRPALAAGTVILFVIFSRALSSVVLLSGPGTELLSIVLFKYFNAGQLEPVCALAVVMLLINVVGLLVARRLGFFGAIEPRTSTAR